MKKPFSLAWIALAIAALVLAPAASAIVPCDSCEPDASVFDRCIGSCNGIITLFCVDYFNLGCSGLPLLTSSPPNPLDTIFPKPFFFQVEQTLASGPTLSPACL